MTDLRELLKRTLEQHDTMSFAMDQIILHHDETGANGITPYSLRCSCGHVFRPSVTHTDEFTHLADAIATALEREEVDGAMPS